MRSQFKIKTIILPKPHHSDPPGLWIGVTFVSIAFHLCLFWMLRSAILAEKSGHAGEIIVPIETIAIAAEKPKTQPTPIPKQSDRSQKQSLVSPAVSSSTQKRTHPKSITPKTSPKPPTPTPSPQKNNPPPKPPTPTPSPQKNNPPPKPPTPTPSPQKNNPPPKPPTPTPSPQKNTPPPKPPTPTPPPATPKPTPTPSPETPKPTPTPSPETPKPTPTPSPETPTPSDGDRFIATIGDLQLTQGDRDIPDRLARRKQNEKQLNAIDYLTPLGLNIEGEFAIEVVAAIDSNGKPSVYPESIQVLSGNIPLEKAKKLAIKIIEQWEFEPTYMGSEPVVQEYRIRLSTRRF